MTSAIQKAIEESREREERLRDAMLDADNDPTEAAVARATLSGLCFEFRFREALAAAVEELTGYLKTSYRLRAEESLLRIETILKGEK